MPNYKCDVNLDSVLVEIGEYGRYQIQNYVLILVAIITSALYNSQYIFTAADVKASNVLHCGPSSCGLTISTRSYQFSQICRGQQCGMRSRRRTSVAADEGARDETACEITFS
ncbi:jg1997 [Pararge aegeria aegeria]|uniref:Jg1997 protein n=1 Tax=Pararge aegeria aegeria TaxID=348720 RepID=A0A8S4SAT1_9NEOP|nr:jg1997 [Pararge aegeria aegeria]